MRYQRKFAVCAGIILVVIALICTEIFSQRLWGIRTLTKKILSIPDTMLIRYYWTTDGSVIGGRYEELILSTTGIPDQLRLDYAEGDAGSDPVCMTINVSDDAARLCYQSIAKAKMRKWNGMKRSIALSGVGISCTFRDGNEYICASTNAMPKDGEKKLNQIRKILMSYVKEARCE